MESTGRYETEVNCNMEETELRLGLPGSTDVATVSKSNKRVTRDVDDEDCVSKKNEAKAQVVGWPPVRSYRRNNIQTKKIDQVEDIAGIYVKVSMDGAPYLRKIALKVYKGYKELRAALEDMFKCFSLGEYVITYEDKDGDWMMVGDVPWEMFISSCKRLRIMKGSEARGLGSNQ